MSDKPNIPAPNSLVKYLSATLVSSSGKPIKDKKKVRYAAPQSITLSFIFISFNVIRFCKLKNKKVVLFLFIFNCLTSYYQFQFNNQNYYTNAQTEDILNSILPPRVSYIFVKLVIYNGKIIIVDLMCSSNQAKREDVILLQENLDKKIIIEISQRICCIREELYAQCFDALIRQVNKFKLQLDYNQLCLLVCVRDEIRQTIQAYQTLFESSIAFGMRKAQQAEQRKTDYNNKIKQLETECQIQLNKLKKQRSQDQKQQENEEAMHRVQVNFLKNANKVYKEELEKFLQGANVKKCLIKLQYHINLFQQILMDWQSII